MMPTLEPGEFVLVNTSKRPRVGDLVVADHPERGMQLVKRVQRINAAGEFVLLSDSQKEGTDSRSFGPVSSGAVAGVVTLSLEHVLKELRQKPLGS